MAFGVNQRDEPDGWGRPLRAQSSDGTLCRRDFLEDPGGAPIPAETFRAPAGGGGEFLCEVWVSLESFDCLDPSLGLVGRDEESVFAMDDDLSQGGQVAGDNGSASGHGLEEFDGAHGIDGIEVFLIGQQGDIHLSVPREDLAGADERVEDQAFGQAGEGFRRTDQGHLTIGLLCDGAEYCQTCRIADAPQVDDMWPLEAMGVPWCDLTEGLEIDAGRSDMQPF